LAADIAFDAVVIDSVPVARLRQNGYRLSVGNLADDVRVHRRTASYVQTPALRNDGSSPLRRLGWLRWLRRLRRLRCAAGRSERHAEIRRDRARNRARHIIDVVLNPFSVLKVVVIAQLRENRGRNGVV